MAESNVITPRPVCFRHLVLEGTAYEAGRQLGEFLRQSPAALGFFVLPEPSPLYAELRRLYEDWCPGLNEELQGAAEGLGVEPERTAFYSSCYARLGQCTHWAVLPRMTQGGRVLVGRSYEYKPEESDLSLCTLRVKGKLAHVGFMECVVGRDDGLNEAGLCVTMSNGGAHSAPAAPGPAFWITIRALLDHARTVDDALHMLRYLPTGPVNLILADRTGQAALVEIVEGRAAVKHIGPEGGEPYLVAANSYTLPETAPYNRYNNPAMLENSAQRRSLVGTRLQAAAPGIDEETCRELLSHEFPAGLCWYYYTHHMGTLWAAIFDVTGGNVEVCFGAPTHNPWRRFAIAQPAGITEYQAVLPYR